MYLSKIFEKIISLRDKYIHLINDASYYTEKDGDTLNIYFEWSNGKLDWLNNFKFAAVSVTKVGKPYKDMPSPWKAHRGFLSVWKVIEFHIKEQILDPSIKNIRIAGYSHGAAIALLCHEYCKFNRPDCDILGYGFGCPRVVWGKPSKEVLSRFDGFSVVRCGCDIVTYVPPKLFGYIDVGRMLLIGQGQGHNPIDSHRDHIILAELNKIEQSNYDICPKMFGWDGGETNDT